MTTPAAFANNWHLLRNERLPPVLTPFWTYDADSWSWQPYQYSSYGMVADNPSTIDRDYRSYLKVQEPNVVNPLILARGGLAEVDIDSIESETTYAYPDLRSDTARSRALLLQYWKIMKAKGLIPSRVAY